MFGKKVVLPAAGLILTSVLLPVFAARNGASAPANYTVDPVHSSAIFRIKHMNVSYFWGRFNDVSGTIAWDAENPEASSFDVRIKTESVDSNSKARDNHLKGPDFFNAKQFPVMSFKSSGVKKAGDNAYEVTGELTLHGVTKPLTAKIEMTGEGKGMQGGKVVGFETTFEIKRGEFGMTGGKGALGEDVRVVVSLEAASK
jgi:polyisoprenoid-binding protein YceI